MTFQDWRDESQAHGERAAISDEYARDVMQAQDEMTLQSHEPPRNSGEGDAVNGPTPLVGESNAGE